MIVVSFTTVLGISVITTSLVMLFSYIPIMIHNTNTKVLDLPPKTRQQVQLMSITMILHWISNLYFGYLLITLTQKQKKCINFFCSMCGKRRKNGELET